MKNGVPVVVIWGDNFVSKKLLENMAGESVAIVTNIKSEIDDIKGKNVVFIDNLKDVEINIDYVFDFEGDESVWRIAEKAEARLVVVEVDKGNDNNLVKLMENKADWRLVSGYGVYGLGMEMEQNWVARLLKSAVLNRELELPKDNGFLRSIEVNDFVEVLKKACFVPGISRERLFILGKKVNVDEICLTMINKAKMTKKGVMVTGENSMEVEDTVVRDYWEKIAWDGGGDFGKKVDGTLKYFFEQMDSLIRSRKEGKKIVKGEAERKRERIMQVEIDEGELETSNEIQEMSNEKSTFAEATADKPFDSAQGKQDLGFKKEDLGVATELQKEDDEVEEAEEVVGSKLIVDDSLVWKPKIKQDLGFKKADISMATEATGVIQTQEAESLDKEDDYENGNKIDLGQFEIKGKIVNNKTRETEKKKRFKLSLGLNWKWVVGPVLIMVVVLVGLYGSFFGRIWMTAQAIGESKSLIEARDKENLVKLADKNLARIETLKKELMWMSGNGTFFSYKGYGEVLRVLETVWQTEKEMADFFEQSMSLSEAVFGEEEIDWQETKKEMTDKLSYLENQLGMIEARTGGDWSFLPGRFKTIVSDRAKEAREWRQLVTSIVKSVDVFYYLLGADGARRDFLVLLQNEAELRPNGGFIGSYGVMSVENGRFLSFDIGDIYDIDGQLKGHVEPPKQIKEILNEPSWYLRDANWQASFPESAKDIDWFFKKETERNIDGIITIDLAVAKNLVGAVGEVWVADFNEKVTSDNLYDQAQFHSESGFFAGSRQKSMFLGKLAGQLMEEIKTAKDYEQIEIVKAMLNSLESNDMQVWVKDKDMKVKLADLGWDGSMYSGGCGMENCLADYLYVVEANLGVNKSNYFLRRGMEMTIDVSNRAVSRVLKINYENTSRSTAWPGGDYKNYMRVYLPKDINIAEVAIYDSLDKTNKKVLGEEEIEISNKYDKKELAFLMTVPVTKKRTVEIRYTSQIDLNIGDEFTYLNYIQRQSGYGDTSLVSLVSFPEDWLPVQVDPAATVVNGKLLFSQQFTKDLRMGVVVGK